MNVNISPQDLGIHNDFVWTNKGKLHTQEYWIESHQIEFDALTFDWLNNEFCQIALLY